MEDVTRTPPALPRPPLAIPLLATLSLTLTPVPAAEPSPAAAPEDSIPLAPIMVTATRGPEEPFDIPFAGDIIGVAEFEQRLPRTLPDALRESPSVMLQKTGHGQGSPFIRGFTGFRTLMLIDGIRLNNSTFREGPNQYWSTIDPLALDRLELVRGPSSVLYGSDAIGGTVNALSRTPTLLDPGVHPWGGTFYRYASAEDSHTGRAEFGISQEARLGFQGGVSFKSYGDLRGGQDIGLQPRTGYDEWDADAKFEWRPAPNQSLILAHQSVDQDDVWRTHSTIYAKPWEGTTPGTDLARVLDQTRVLDYAQFRAWDLEGFVDRLSASLSYQLQDEDEMRRLTNRRDEQTTRVDTVGFSLQLEKETRAGHWTAGTEYYHDWVESSFRRYRNDGSLQLQRLQGPVADDSSYDLLGVYLQDQIPLASDRLELTLGGRYNHAHAHAARAEDPYTRQLISFEDSWSTLIGSGRALWHVDADRRWNLFGGVSQGFRAPNLSDLSRFDIARTGEQEVPSFHLDPEHFVSFEGGVKTRHGRFSAEAAYYYTLIDDMIVRVLTGDRTPAGDVIVTKENSGNGFLHGVELEAEARLISHLTLWGNLTWMEGRVEGPTLAGGPTQEEPVSRLMPLTGNIGLRWDNPEPDFWVEFAASLVDAQGRLSSGDARDTQRIPPGGTPGYEVFHLRAGWRPRPWATLSLALENLADADYRVHGSGLNEPGRNLVVACALRF